MKFPILFFLVLLFSSVPSFCQEYFKIEENDIIWQRIYETPLSFVELSTNLINSGIYVQYEIYNNNITGDLKELHAQYEDAGYSTGLTPMVISGNLVSAFSLVEYREGRYRVTLKKIALTKSHDDPFSKQGHKSTLKEVAINNKGDFRNWFVKHSVIYDITFDQIFDIKPKVEEGW